MSNRALGCVWVGHGGLGIYVWLQALSSGSVPQIWFFGLPWTKHLCSGIVFLPWDQLIMDWIFLIQWATLSLSFNLQVLGVLCSIARKLTKSVFLWWHGRPLTFHSPLNFERLAHRGMVGLPVHSTDQKRPQDARVPRLTAEMAPGGGSFMCFSEHQKWWSCP